MKLPLDINALSTRHSFTGEEPTYILEATILGNALRIPISPLLVSVIDEYIATKVRDVQTQDEYKDERREYPPSYDQGVDYELGSVSINDMEEL